MVADGVPLEAYETEVAPRARTAIVMAVLWGVPMVAVMLVIDREQTVARTLVSAAIGAALFGGLWTVWMARSLRALVRRLYIADPDVTPPPPDGEWAVRLLCNLMLAGNFAVGGHLYAGRARWVFVPHRKNLPRHQTPTAWSVTDLASVAVVPLEKGPFMRLLSPGATGSVEVETRAGARYRFVAPRAEAAADLLNRARAGAV